MAQYPCRCGSTCARSDAGNCHGQVVVTDGGRCPEHLCETHLALAQTKPRPRTCAATRSEEAPAWALAAAKHIISDLKDRRGLRHEWEMIDADVALEIETTWAKVIYAALKGAP